MGRRQHAHSRKHGTKPIPPEAQEMLLEEFAGACAYCGTKAETWDHIVPVAHGGQTTPGNVVPACMSCNSSKKNCDVFEWMDEKGIKPSDRFLDRYILSYAGLFG
jgi:5-methylcytosine-specific restriction endonuclease McrA